MKYYSEDIINKLFNKRLSSTQINEILANPSIEIKDNKILSNSRLIFRKDNPTVGGWYLLKINGSDEYWYTIECMSSATIERRVNHNLFDNIEWILIEEI